MTDREPSSEPLDEQVPSETADRPQREALPSKPSSGHIIGGMLAGLEGIVTGRPKAIPQIEEQYEDEWASAGGLTVEGLDEPIDRPEQPDRSGARL